MSSSFMKFLHNVSDELALNTIAPDKPTPISNNNNKTNTAQNTTKTQNKPVNKPNNTNANTNNNTTSTPTTNNNNNNNKTTTSNTKSPLIVSNSNNSNNNTSNNSTGNNNKNSSNSNNNNRTTNIPTNTTLDLITNNINGTSTKNNNNNTNNNFTECIVNLTSSSEYHDSIITASNNLNIPVIYKWYKAGFHGQFDHVKTESSSNMFSTYNCNISDFGFRICCSCIANSSDSSSSLSSKFNEFGPIQCEPSIMNMAENYIENGKIQFNMTITNEQGEINFLTLNNHEIKIVSPLNHEFEIVYCLKTNTQDFHINIITQDIIRGFILEGLAVKKPQTDLSTNTSNNKQNIKYQASADSQRSRDILFILISKAQNCNNIIISNDNNNTVAEIQSTNIINNETHSSDIILVELQHLLSITRLNETYYITQQQKLQEENKRIHGENKQMLMENNQLNKVINKITAAETPSNNINNIISTSTSTVINNNVNSELIEIEKKLRGELAKSNKELNELRTGNIRIQEIEKENNDLSSEIINLKKRVEKLEKENIRLKQGEKEYIEAQAQLKLNEKYKLEYESFKNNHTQIIKDLENEKIQTQQLNNKIIKLNEEIENHKIEANSIKMNSESLESKIIILESANEELKTGKNFWKKKCESLQLQLDKDLKEKSNTLQLLLGSTTPINTNSHNDNNISIITTNDSKTSSNSTNSTESESSELIRLQQLVNRLKKENAALEVEKAELLSMDFKQSILNAHNNNNNNNNSNNPLTKSASNSPKSKSGNNSKQFNNNTSSSLSGSGNLKNSSSIENLYKKLTKLGITSSTDTFTGKQKYNQK